MRGTIRLRHLLLHPYVTVRYYGLRLLLRAIQSTVRHEHKTMLDLTYEKGGPKWKH